MVAVVSGSGLGLFGSSLSTLGGAGAAGNVTVGRGGDRAYVNSATGNLIVQSQDEVLSALGLDLALVRTYNSQGVMNDDNGDNWRLGVHQRVYELTGTVNSANSTITKVFGDGREVLYRYDAQRSLYVSTEGDGAHDTLEYAEGEWTWTDGSGRNAETYNAEGQLTGSIDADGNAITYAYTNSLLTQITDGSGQTTHLDYVGNNLQQIRVVSNGQTQTLTRYFYDSLDRLRQVIVDLTPADNSAPLTDSDNDGLIESTANQTYVTTYTYDADSRRIASIAQSDGSSVAFTYELIDDAYRIRTYTDAEGRVTTLTYTQPSTTVIGTETVETPANTSGLSTTDSQTTTTTHSLNENALTQFASLFSSFSTSTSIAGTWGEPTLLESSATATNDARIAFDADGNGFSIWRAGGNLFVRQYTRATNTWSDPVALDERNNTVTAPALAVDADGNAVVAWVQSDGTANSVWASYYHADWGVWDGPILLETSSLAVSTAIFSLSVAVRGERAGVTWLQTDGTRNNLYVSSALNGEWGPPEVIEDCDDPAAQPFGTIDENGNAMVVWQQSDGVANSIWVNRWDEIAQQWTGATLLETSATAANNPEVKYDRNGNALAIWRAGNNLYARRYDAASATWAPAVILDTRTNTIQSLSLAVDEASGDAIAAWVQSDGTANSAYVARFDSATLSWTAPMLLEAENGAVATGYGNIVTSISGDTAAVAWLQSNGTANDVVVSTFDGGSWSTPMVLDGGEGAASQPVIALDRSGNLTALFKQSDGTADSVYSRRFTVAGERITHTLDTAELTLPTTGPWPQAQLMSADRASLVAFNSSGDGFSVRTENTATEGAIVYVRRYTASTNDWSTDVRIDSPSVMDYNVVHELAIDEEGNALIVWLGSDANGLLLQASAFDATSLTWSGATTVAAGSGYPIIATASMRDGAVAISWIELSVDTEQTFVRASTLTPQGWSTSSSQEVSMPQWPPLSTIDAAGNVLVTWSDAPGSSGEGDFTGLTTQAMQYSAASGTWGDVSTLSTDDFVLALQANDSGTAVRLSIDDENLYAYYLSADTNTWSEPVVLATSLYSNANVIGLPSLSVDEAGNALVAWTEGASLKIRTFDAATATWAEPITLQTSMPAQISQGGHVATSLRNGRAAVAFAHVTANESLLFATHLNDGGWIEPIEIARGDLELDSMFPETLYTSLETDGTYSVVWQVRDTNGNAQVYARSLDSTSGGASYTVPAGATWQSIASTLYGVDSFEAGETLRRKLGNPSLAAGAQLTGFPSALVVGNSTQHALNTAPLTWAGANASPVVQSYLDEAGRTVATLHADGTFTSFTFAADGQLVSTRTHANAPIAPLWSQDFSQDAAGFSPLHSGFMTLANGGLTVTTLNNVEYGWRMSFGDRTYSFSDHVVFRAEVTTGSSSNGRAFNIGAENVNETRRHSAMFGDGGVSVSYYDNGWQTAWLGSVANDTSYVVEVVTHAQGSSLYVFEKGTDKHSGYVHHLSYSDWGNARSFFETFGDPSQSVASIRLDNLSEAAAPGALIGGLIAVESDQDTVGVAPGWATARLLEGSTISASAPTIAYDANGNGLAAWAQGNEVIARRYDAGLDRWGPATIVHSGSQLVLSATLSVDRASGNAVVAWVRNDGSANSLYASVLDADTGIWGPVQTLETESGAVSFGADTLSVSMAGEAAAVAWLQHDGTAVNVRLSVLENAVWSASALIDAGAADAMQPQVAVDSAGNATVLWRQANESGSAQIYVNRWNSTTQSFSGATVLDAASDGERFPKIALDAQGNAFALWSMELRRFDALTGTWGPTIELGMGASDARGWDLAVDQDGNALVSWIEGLGEGNVVAAQLYNAATQEWGEPSALEFLSAPVDTDNNGTVADLQGGEAVVAWVQSNGVSNSVYAARMSNGVWGTGQLIETRDETPSDVTATVDAAGNATVLWVQADGASSSIFAARFNGPLPLQYVVPTGATWRSVANTLYGINDPQAGEALRLALGDPPLTAGTRLSNLPASLEVSISTSPPSEPYYAVPAGATWQSTAADLYGADSIEAGEALRIALGNPELTEGAQLTNLPATIEVTRTETITVPAYYTVQQDDTWEGITQSIYGTADANVIVAFQTAVGTPALTTGTRITVPLTLTYTSTETSTLYLQTDVENALGLVTTYTRDPQGRLTRVQTPAVNGTRLDTRYGYDADGNVVSITEDPDGSNRVTQFEYDENGNLELTRDAGGNTITRTYNENNQLLTETRYLVPDTDGAGAAQPSVPVTTRYVYDSGTPASESHLRFMISPEGRVIEHQYNAAGQRSASFKYTEAHYTQASFAESDLIAWASTQNATRERTDYAYDFRGNISQVTRWNRPELVDEPLPEPSVTKFVYDQRGQLLQTIEARGSAIAADPANANLPYATTYTYDGLGRVLTSTQWTSDDFTNGLSTTITQYDDANRRTVITLANNLVTTSTYNAAGELTSVIQGSNGDLGTTRYTYDDAGRLRMTTDPTGLRRFYLYDEVGRKTGEIDPDGTLTELIYNANSELIKSVQYAALIDQVTLASLVDASGDPTDVSFAALRSAASGNAADDRISRNVYDRVGRLVYSIDGAGAVTQFFYDGAGRLTDEIRYANTVSIDRTVDELSASAFASGGAYEINPSAQDDRHTRHFYDADGNLIGTLDGEGYLVEYEYDPGGYLFQQIAYATRTNAQYWEAGTLEQLRPEPTTPEVPEFQDVHTYFFYDGQGRQIGVLDGEGFLTRTRYDVAGHIIETTRYGGSVDFETSMEFGDVVWAASREWVDYGWGYGYGEGYGYGGYWVDAEAQSDTFQYDGAGRLISTTNHEENVTEYEYDAAGQLIRTTRDAEYDPRTTSVRYDELGRVIQELTAEGYAQLQALQSVNPAGTNWDAEFGNMNGWTRTVGNMNVTSGGEGYFARDFGAFFYGVSGASSKAYQRVDLLSLERLPQVEIDAGQVSITVDWWGGTLEDATTNFPALNLLFRDENGNLIGTHQSGYKTPSTLYVGLRWDQYQELASLPAGTRYIDIELEASGSSGDGFNAVFDDIAFSFNSPSVAAAVEQVWNEYGTRYSYDAAGRRITATRQPNDEQTLTTFYFYDGDGRLRFEVNPAGERKELRYNAFGELTDEIRYINRISTVGLSGGLLTAELEATLTELADQTKDSHISHTFTPNGRLRTTQSAEGAQTQREYNAFGEVVRTTQAIETNRSVVHEYDYDRKGLLTDTRWDPTGLNTTEQRQYDAFGRLTHVTDARDNTSRFFYDRRGLQVDAVSPLNGHRYSTYDAFLRLTRTETPHITEYEHDLRATSVYLLGGGEGGDISTYFNGHGQTEATVIDGDWTEYSYDLNGNLIYASDDLGTIEERTHDRANRQITQIDANGILTRLIYDNANRVVSRAVDPDGLNLVTQYVYDGLGRLTEVIEPNGRRTVTEYDRDGRVTAVTVDPEGAAEIRTEYAYDLAGNRVLVTEGAGSAPKITLLRYDSLNRLIEKIIDPTGHGGSLNLSTEYKYDENGNLTRLIDAKDNSIWYVYDSNNRVIQTIDALGGVTETTYDDDGHVLSTRRYANTVNVSGLGDAPTAAQIAPSDRDRLTRSFYNNAAQEIFTVDSMGGVTERQFDTRGNITWMRVYDTPIDLSLDATEEWQVQDALFEALSNRPSEEDKSRTRMNTYDARGRLVLTADYSGALTRNTYDGNGNLIETTTFAEPIFETWSVGDWLPDSIANAARDRTTRYWYDASDRMRFKMDAEGYLTEIRYDDVNRIEVRTAYSVHPSNIEGSEYWDYYDLEQLIDTLADGTQQTTITHYDAAGRVARITDSVGNYEEFTYDAVGNRLTYRNQAGAVWTYDYDANGRLIEEVSPIVDTTIISVGSNALQSDTQAAAIVTRMTYDSLGNVETRTEGIRRFTNGTEDSSTARTTTYRYDRLGRQTITEHPAVSVYSAPANDAENTDPSAMLQELYDTTLTTVVSYNALGDAVVNVDISEAVTRKTYDNLGRVHFEVDALGHVTEYEYDVFGNVTRLTRFATSIGMIQLPAGEWTSSQINDYLLRGDSDRTIITEYDMLGRQVRVQQPETFVYATYEDEAESAAAPNTSGETTYSYDAFGQVTSKRVLLDPTLETYAETYYFYDLSGRLEYEVDASGHVTRKFYDAQGNVRRQIEYARPLSGGPPWDVSQVLSSRPDADEDTSFGIDRDTEFVYDSLNRLREQRVRHVEMTTFIGSTPNTEFWTQVTTFDYDAVGNRTRITNHEGASTYTYYDALGRIVAIAEPQRLADSNGDYTAEAVVPFIELRRDVYGNLVQEVRYQSTATLVDDRYIAPASGDARSTYLLLDVYGRAVRTQDAAGANRFASYTRRGDVAKEWQAVTNADGVSETIVTIHEYDALGREITTIEPVQKSETDTTEVRGFIDESMRWYQVAGGAPIEWVGENRIRVTWPEIRSGSVRVVVEYTRKTREGGAGEPYMLQRTYSSTRSGETITWTDAADLTHAGIHSIDRILVYAIDENGAETIIRDSDAPPQAVETFYRQTVYTQLKYNSFGEVVAKGVNETRQDALSGTFQEYFEYDNAGRVRRTNSGDGVDKMYLYDAAGRTTAEIRSQQVGLIVSLADESAALALPIASQMRTETVYNSIGQVVEQRLPSVTLGEGTPGGGDAGPVTALIADSERIDRMTNPDPPYDYWYRWQGENDISLTWDDVGAIPVRVVYTYTTLPGSYYGYNTPQAISVTRTVDRPSGGTGFRDDFTTSGRRDDWVIEYGFSFSPAGVSSIDAVDVYGQDANGEYTVLLRTLGGTGGGTPQPEPEPEVVTRTMTQQSDRWGNVLSYTNTAQETTEYRYSVLGTLLETWLPEVAVLDTRDTAGSSIADRTTAADAYPVLRNYYDILGRAIGSQDANGNVNSVELDTVGQVLNETHADGGRRWFTYDTFGNQAQIVNETGWRTRNEHDEANRIVTVRSEVDENDFIVRQFGYDEAGRRISETSGEFMDDGSTAETTKYFYDLNGNLVTRRTAMGHETSFEYDVRGNKVFEKNGVGDSMSWQHDAFGRVLSHHDLGGIRTDYAYNGAGLAQTQTNTLGQDIAYAYDEAGNLITIDDQGVDRLTEYEYDAAGRRSRERTTIDGLAHQDTQIEYDAHGRIASLTDLRYELTYQYDAQGNRTRVTATYNEATGLKTQDLWYTYDEMNRVTLSQGAAIRDTSGNITDIDITSSQGVRIEYNAAGQRISAEQYGEGKLRETINETWNPNGGSNFETQYGTVFGLYEETYGYDGLGRLRSIARSGETINAVNGMPWGTATEFGPTTVHFRTYDDASRLIGDNSTWFNTESTGSVYDDDGRLRTQTTYSAAASNAPRLSETIFYYDAADVLRSYHVTAFNNTTQGESVRYTTHYYNYYLNADTYLATGESVSTNVPNGTGQSGSVTRSYNVNRELVSVVDNNDNSKNRYFANNANGQALTVVQGDYPTEVQQNLAFSVAIGGGSTTSRSQHFFFANGHSVGTLGQLQSDNPSNRRVTADFDVNFTPISDQFPASTPSHVVAQEGDTLRSIALRVFGDETLWYLIADENGDTNPDELLLAGRMLRIPNEVFSLSNTANSFKPFNVTEAIGDVSATQVAAPPPNAGKGCGVLGTILILAVAIVVTVYTAGLAAGGTSAVLAGGGTATSTMAAGTAALGGGLASTGSAIAAAAVGGAVGSAVSQGVAIAAGIQDGFDWKSVAFGAVGAGVTAGLGGLVTQGSSAFAKGLANFRSGSPSLYAAANGAAASAITQGIAVATGIQSSFSWRDVAISAVAAPVAQSAASMAPASLGTFGRSFVGGIAGTQVRRAFGGKIDTATMIADAFGNALGNAIVDLSMEAINVAQLAATTGKTKEQVQALLDEVKNRRSGLSGEDRENPLFLALSSDVPGDVKRNLWKQYLSGAITFDVTVDDLDTWGDYSPGADGGSIRLNQMLVGEMNSGNDFAGALLLSALWEEQGHALDHMARELAGMSGTDSVHDEGALFSLLMTERLAASGVEGAFGFATSLSNGTTLQITTQSAHMKAVALNTIFSGRLVSENRDVATGREMYGPAGHYYTTALIALDVGTYAGMEAAEARLFAGRLALWSQIPDMLESLDAKSQWQRDAFGNGLGFSSAERVALEGTFEAIHNLPSSEYELTRGWVLGERSKAAGVVTGAIAAGRFDLAGFAIHKLGDSFAHTHSGGLPFNAPHGHAVASIGAGLSAYLGDPDDLFDSPARAHAYSQELAWSLAKGLGTPDTLRTAAVTAGTATWSRIYSDAQRKPSFFRNTDEQFQYLARRHLSGPNGIGLSYLVNGFDVRESLSPRIPRALTGGHSPGATLRDLQQSIFFTPSVPQVPLQYRNITIDQIFRMPYR